MADDVVVKATNVSKKFCRTLKHVMRYGVKDITRNAAGLSSRSERLRDGEFWAVNDVSFELKRGETLGIIGPNGSGKSTILKMLNGIYMPDRGRIEMKGRVGALIEVGAGFHPMLSGRENIYINGTILGMSKKEIDKKFDKIVNFADIGDFIDSPVKHYSSGMYVRLGLAVAINVRPDILLIDEVLSVGDLSFQNKSLRRLNELRQKANAIIFVSHNLEHVRNLCDKVIVLNNGNLEFCGSTHEAILKYHEISQKKRLLVSRSKEKAETDTEVLEVVLNDVGILDKLGNKTDKISFGDDVITFFEFELNKDMEELYFSVGILDERAINCIWQMSNDNKLKFRNIVKGKYKLTVNYREPNLVPGVYSPAVAIRSGLTGETYDKIKHVTSFRIRGDIIPRGVIHTESRWDLQKVE